MRATMNELYESYYHGLVLCAFLWSVEAVLGAASFIAPEAAPALQLAARVFGLLKGTVFLVTAVIFMLRQTRLYLSLSGPADLRRRGRLSEDGFTFHALKTAALLSGALTVVTLYVLNVAAADTVLPPTFFIDLLSFVSLGTFSTVYFLLHVGSRAESAGGEAMP